MNVILIIFFLSCFLLIFGFLSLLLSRRIERQWNIPKGPIIYADISRPEKTLSSKSLCLRGKPDYIVRTNRNEIVPVEVKTGNHTNPKPWHIMQLIAYCHLVSEHYDLVVSHGILVYYDTKKQFRIPYSKKYQNQLILTVENMYDHMWKNTITHIPNNVSRCRHCSFHQVCPHYEHK
jgi:CRISPR-associated exonuclease Cas4